MAAPPVLPPPGYEFGDARRAYVERYGSILIMNTYLQIALVGVTVVAVGVILLAFRIERAAEHVKPLVIRIDEVGRATAVSETNLTYTPQAPELKYFLVQFVTAYYSRMRATVRRQFAESLYFLDGRLADATIETNKKSGTIERFLTDGSDEIEVRVRNVTLEDLRQPPYRAAVEFDQIHLPAGSRIAQRRETYVAHLVFVMKDPVDNARIPINPLGLTITYFREDQAFVTDVERVP